MTTTAGSSLTIDLSRFVTEGGVVSTLAFTKPANGTLLVEGVVATYVPSPGFYGVDGFTLRVCDQSEICLDVLVSITVPPVNDFLLKTGAALSQFFAGVSSSPEGSYNMKDPLSGTAQGVLLPLVGLTAVAGGSLMFGLDSVGSVFRRWLAALAVKA